MRQPPFSSGQAWSSAKHAGIFVSALEHEGSEIEIWCTICHSYIISDYIV
jgi:hypothetical protein